MSEFYDPIFALLALSVLVLILGAFYGSFCSKVVFRLSGYRTRGMTLFSRSVCPSCGKSLSLADKIPIISYFNLKGHCRKCDAPISKVYVLFEFLGMLLPFFFLWYDNFSLIGLVDYMIAMAFISDFFIYRETKQYPLTISFYLIVLGFLLILFNYHLFLEAFLGFILAITITLIMNFVLKKDKNFLENAIFFCSLGFIFDWVGLGILLLIFLILIPINGLINIIFDTRISKGSLLMVASLINLLFIDYFQEILQKIITFLVN